MSVVVERVHRGVEVVVVVMAIPQLAQQKVFAENYHCKNNSVTQGYRWSGRQLILEQGAQDIHIDPKYRQER